MGYQNNGSIIASYATGNADGGTGDSDIVGDLVGLQSGGSRTESYGFGAATGETPNTLGDPPTDVTSATGLTAANAGAQWVVADSPWDFGGSSQTPALMYVTGAMLSGTTVTYQCEASELPSGLSCGDLLAGQDR